MPVIFQHSIYRRDLRANPSLYYVFGDNLIKAGYGGQAAAMRGEPNAIGIPTKRLPDITDESYFYDDEISDFIEAVQPVLIYISTLLSSGATIVMPLDGIGGGRAKLHLRPKIWAYLNEELDKLGLISKKGNFCPP